MQHARENNLAGCNLAGGRAAAIHFREGKQSPWPLPHASGMHKSDLEDNGQPNSSAQFEAQALKRTARTSGLAMVAQELVALRPVTESARSGKYQEKSVQVSRYRESSFTGMVAVQIWPSKFGCPMSAVQSSLHKDTY